MCYGWATTIEREMFKRFPTVVFCGTTFDTNKEDHLLLLLRLAGITTVQLLQYYMHSYPTNKNWYSDGFSIHCWLPYMTRRLCQELRCSFLMVMPTRNSTILWYHRHDFSQSVVMYTIICLTYCMTRLEN